MFRHFTLDSAPTVFLISLWAFKLISCLVCVKAIWKSVGGFVGCVTEASLVAACKVSSYEFMQINVAWHHFTIVPPQHKRLQNDSLLEFAPCHFSSNRYWSRQRERFFSVSLIFFLAPLVSCWGIEENIINLCFAMCVLPSSTYMHNFNVNYQFFSWPALQ